MALQVACIFQDHMVLQRRQPIPVWGRATPGAAIVARLAGTRARATTTAAADGRWRLCLPAREAGGPHELVVQGDGGRAVFRDVLLGEVWVCSGQSNMEWNLSLANDAEAEIAAARFPDIRLLTVQKNAVTVPQEAFKGSWQACTPDTVGTFSAVGYFFGRELHRALGVPVGLINSSWGGTLAEAWTSRAGLELEPALRPFIERLDRVLGPDGAAERKAYRDALAAYEKRTVFRDPGNRGLAEGWAAPGTDSAAWATMELPGNWQSAGHDVSGVFWFRRDLELPAAWAGRDLELNIGACDKDDDTYFNNEHVGRLGMADRPDAWCTPRSYTVPGRFVKAGRNVVAVRVFSNMYQGGMIGPAGKMWLAPVGAAAAERLPLTGTWRYRIEHNFGKVVINPPPAPWGDGNQNTPASLYNGMLAPVAPYGIRGAIWYQGESNAGRPTEYRTLFPAMIRDWRRVWGLGDFPFYFVQLANYMAAKPEPGESQWAELREAQRLTTGAVPNAGMAVIIDIGEAGDIHPRNKQDVGRRLARLALVRDYGCRDRLPEGPLPCAARVQDDGSVLLRFSGAGTGLSSAAAPELRGFAVAGTDRVFRWATATIAGTDTVRLACAAVPAPCWVRHAWADNPPCDLRNSEALPASPFEVPLPWGTWLEA